MQNSGVLNYGSEAIFRERGEVFDEIKFDDFVMW